MTDDTSQEPELTSEDLAALAALEMLNRPWANGDHSDSLEREYLELLGLVPYALEPEAPSASVKKGLLERVAQSGSQSDRQGVARVVPFAEPSREPARPASSRVAWALAAALAAVSLGLASWAGVLQGRLVEQEKNVAEVVDAPLPDSLPSDAQPEPSVRFLAVSDLQDTIARVAMPGVEVCPMRPLGDSPAQPSAKGLFYLSSERSEWMLAAQNLEPSVLGSRYHVWFRTEGGVINGGAFEVHQSGAILIRADQIPAGSQAVLITLETEETGEPTGPTILYGDEGEIMG